MIEAMKQAREVIELGDDASLAQRYAVLTNIDQAIAEAEKQEPVAWAQFSEIGNLIDLLEEPCKGYAPLYTHPQPKQEPSGGKYTSYGLMGGDKFVNEDSLKRNIT